jgi:hypothetical protein
MEWTSGDRRPLGLRHCMSNYSLTSRSFSFPISLCSVDNRTVARSQGPGEVGHESTTQFARQYKRLFGQPPMSDIKAVRFAEAEA